jgi:A/G-specific adenine glycosylase
MDWHYTNNTRIMPWKGELDPYKIWISEIILQQTRVSQGKVYFNKFMNAFPTLQHLAEADDATVFKTWEGLGYYTRCKNLLVTARFIFNELNGKFPKTYRQIMQLKGIGPYTAAAIASFAFNLPHAVVDGNVYRVLARYFGNFMPIDTTEGKKLFTAKANLLLDKKNPAGYNQAIMDFGAVICKPQPECHLCPFQSTCKAFKNEWINELPVKKKLKAKKKRWLYYFVISVDGKYLVKKRTASDIWQNLYEFYLVEMQEETIWTEQKINKFLHDEFQQVTNKRIVVSPNYSQTLTHQQLQGRFIHVDIRNLPVKPRHMQLCSPAEIASLAFPKFINQHIHSPYFS